MVYISGLDFLVWLVICTGRIYKWCVVLGTRLSVGMQVTHVGGCSSTRLWASGWQQVLHWVGWVERLIRVSGGPGLSAGLRITCCVGCTGWASICRVYIERGGWVSNFRSEVGGTQSQPPNSAAPAFSRGSLRRVASSAKQPPLEMVKRQRSADMWNTSCSMSCCMECKSHGPL